MLSSGAFLPEKFRLVTKLVFWDFDGVIKDSLGVKEEAFASLLAPYGKDVESRVRRHHQNHGGVSRFEKFPLYLSWAGQKASPELIDALSARMADIVRDGVVASAWVPGVERLLRTNPYDQEFVVVSAAPIGELMDIIDRLDLSSCFRWIYGAPMHKSDAIASYIKASGHAPEASLMIGDGLADLEAAEKNNIPFLLRRHESNAAIFRDYNGLSIFDFKEL